MMIDDDTYVAVSVHAPACNACAQAPLSTWAPSKQLLLASD